METGNERQWVRPFLEGKWGRRLGGSTVPEVDNTMKSDAVAREAEGGNWHLEVEDNQRKLDR
jgi:subtilisin-like proprotein convertase family protein